MSLNEHCLHLFNCLLGSIFIYVYLTFKLPAQLVVFPFGVIKLQSNLPYRSPLSNGHFETRPTNITI
jgi:hypothetical protein